MTPYEWLRSRPPAIQALILQFPLVCRVIALKPLLVPAQGRVGRVVSYMEDGTVTVMDEEAWMADDPAAMRAGCKPEWLQVVQYDGNKTPEWVQRVLAGEDLPALNPGLDGRIDGEMPVMH